MSSNNCLWSEWELCILHFLLMSVPLLQAIKSTTGESEKTKDTSQ